MVVGFDSIFTEFRADQKTRLENEGVAPRERGLHRVLPGCVGFWVLAMSSLPRRFAVDKRRQPPRR